MSIENGLILQLIGRSQGKRNHIEKLKKIRHWCSKYNVLFKINTVVNTYNKDENMIHEINDLNPIRWKVFQCLLLEGENVGEGALRNAEKFYIDDKSFSDFIDRHKSLRCLVPESNVKMQNSYLILDEYVSNITLNIMTNFYRAITIVRCVSLIVKMDLKFHRNQFWMLA